MIFRSRDDQLKVFLRQLHPFLQRQELEYGIYIINQVWHIDKRQETRTIIRDIYYKSGVAYRQETRIRIRDIYYKSGVAYRQETRDKN